MGNKRLAAKLRPAAEKAVKQGHPWVWDNGIEKITDGGQCGDTVIIFDQKKNKFLAVGLYDPASPIAIKVISMGQPQQMDQEWIADSLRAALDHRHPLLATDTNSFRWVYGENDKLPGLIIDVYDDVAVVKLYSLIWEQFLPWITESIAELRPVKAVILRLSRLTAQHTTDSALYYDGAVIHGQLKNSEVVFTEYGLKFVADAIAGHKTGYFLDHRHNRYRVSQLAKGCRVLDVFSYAGGFSVHALAGGAREVTSLDISRQALEMARKNVKLNNLLSRHKIMAIDAFEGMEQLFNSGSKYELIIVDPPSFAKKANEVERALKSYQRLTVYAAGLVSRGGMLVMASCSSRVSAGQFYEAVETTLQKQGHKYEILEKSNHDVDHPILIPEAAYLKCGYYKILN